MSLIDVARNLWLQIRNETVVGANTAIRVGNAGSAILNAIEDANKTISANTFADFDRQLLTGTFRILGHLNGFYIGSFNPPYLEQMVIWDNQIYTRNVNVSVNPFVIPNFGVYGTSQPAPVIVDTTGIRLIPEAPNYTVTIDSPENVQMSAGADGTSVIFPGLGASSKSITFLIDLDSNPITFDGTLIDAGETVFAIFADGAWTINSTVVNIPVIPNYSDISIKALVNTNVSLEIPYSTGTFYGFTPSILVYSPNDLLLLAGQTNKAEIGIYQILIAQQNYVVLRKYVSGVVLNTVRVEGDGAYENQFDGFDANTIVFAKIGTGGTSVPMNVTFFKSGANGIVPMTSFSWIANLIVSQVILQDYATDISVTINGTVYNKMTLIGVSLPIGAKMTGLDMTIQTGYNSGSATIIF